MNRRFFLTGLAIAAAPAIIRTPGLLMPIKPLVVASEVTDDFAIMIAGKPHVWSETQKRWVLADKTVPHWSEANGAAKVLPGREVRVAVFDRKHRETLIKDYANIEPRSKVVSRAEEFERLTFPADGRFLTGEISETQWRAEICDASAKVWKNVA